MNQREALEKLSPDIAQWLRDSECPGGINCRCVSAEAHYRQMAQVAGLTFQDCPKCGKFMIRDLEWSDEYVHASTGFLRCD